MMLCPLSVVLCRVELRPLSLGGESLKVCIDDERSRQLLAVVLKGETVLSFSRYLRPDCGLPNPSTDGSVGFQQIRPCIAMQAALAEVLALLVLTLIVEEPVEILDPGIVKLTGLFKQQHVDPRYLLWLLAKAVDSDALVPAKYANGQVIQLLHFWDLRDGRGGIDPLKVQTILGGYHLGLSG